MMRQFIAGLLIWALAALPASAWFIGGGDKLGFYAQQPTVAVPSNTFLQCADSIVDATTYTFPTQNLGTADAARKIIVAFISEDGAALFDFNSSNVGGVAATRIVNTNHSTSIINGAIFIADVPSGTTGTIDVTMSELTTSLAYCAWAVYDVASSTEVASTSQFSTNSSALTLSINNNSGGFAVGMTGNQNATQVTAWTGLTEDSDTSPGEISYSAANGSTAGTPLAITSDTGGTGDAIGVSASFD